MFTSVSLKATSYTQTPGLVSLAGLFINGDANNSGDDGIISFGRNGYFSQSTEYGRFTHAGYFTVGAGANAAALLHANNSNVLSKPLFRLGRDKAGLGIATPDSVAMSVTGMGKFSISDLPNDTTSQWTFVSRNSGRGSGIGLTSRQWNKWSGTTAGGTPTWAANSDTSSMNWYIDSAGGPRFSMKAVDGDSLGITLDGTYGIIRTNATEFLLGVAGINYSFSANGIAPLNADARSLGSTTTPFKNADLTDNLRLGGKGQTAALYVSGENTIAGQDSSWKIAATNGVPTMEAFHTGSFTNGGRRVYMGTDTLALFNGSKTGRDSTVYAMPDGKLIATSTVTALNFASSANGQYINSTTGNFTLSAEDDLYITCDFNNNDANTRNIIFGKNSYSASTTELARLTEAGDFGLGAIPGARMEINGDKSADTLLIVRNDRTGAPYDSAFVVMSDGSTRTRKAVMYDSDSDSLINNPKGFSATNSQAAGPIAWQLKDGATNLANIDTTGYMLVTGKIETADSLVAQDALRVEGASTFKGGFLAGATGTQTAIANDGDLTVVSGADMKVGAIQWDVVGTDSINGAQIAARTITDLMLPVALTGKAANVSDADFGDVTVSSGAWAVEDDSHNHTSASTKFVINDSLRVEETAIIKGDITAGGKVVVDDSLRVDGPVDINGYLTYDFIHFSAFKDTSIVFNTDGNGVYTKVLPKFVPSYGIVENDGFTFAGDSLTIITPGDYRVESDFILHGPVNTEWKVGIFKNSVLVRAAEITTTGANNRTQISVDAYLLNLAAGDDISIKVANLTNPYTDDPTFTDFNFYCEKKPE
jgi:hypothetical protein